MVQPARHVFTVEEYERMGTAGLFGEDDRVELIEGEIIETAPIGSRHAACVDRLTHLFSAQVSNRAVVRVQNPVRLGARSEPQPDVALLRPKPDFYASAHPEPADVLLIVEVAETSATWDRDVKMPLYAGAGVPEVWVVDLDEGCIDAYTTPHAQRYADARRLTSDDTITPSMLVGVTIFVADILGSR
jgi:Uma2 family endonuclease